MCLPAGASLGSFTLGMLISTTFCSLSTAGSQLLTTMWCSSRSGASPASKMWGQILMTRWQPDSDWESQRDLVLHKREQACAGQPRTEICPTGCERVHLRHRSPGAGA